MRIRTRSGNPMCVPDDSVVRQVKKVEKNETYYILYLQDGREISASHPATGIPIDATEGRHSPNPRIDSVAVAR